MMQELKAVFFDYGGTLDADGTPWFDQFYPIYKEEGLSASRDQFAPAFYAADDSLPGRFQLAGKSLEETVRLQTSLVAAALAPKNPDLAGRVAARYMAGVRKRFDDIRPVLKELSRNFRLGVVSNNYGNLNSMLASEGLLDYFSVVADSGQVGALKPDARLFQHALDALKLTPAQALMVGDSLPRDMRGAEALGMPHAWLAGGRSDSPCCKDVLVLRRLADLPRLLARQEEPA